MEELYNDSGYFRISYFPEKNMLLVHGYKSMTELDEVHYFNELKKYGEAVVKYQPKFILFDTRDAYYPVSAELDAVIERELTPIVMKAGVKKIAFVLPTDIVSQIAVEHLVMNLGIDHEQIQRQFFDSREKAEQWLLE